MSWRQLRGESVESPLNPDAARGAEIIPYFSAAPSVGDTGSRILLVSYHFPPDPSVGGLRWQQMARHFAAKGWTFDVITRDFSSAAGLDIERLSTLPKGTRVYSARDSEPIVGRIEIVARSLVVMLRSLVGSRKIRVQVADTFTRAQLKNQRGGRALLRSFRARIEYARDRKWAAAATRLGLRLSQETRYTIVISSGPPHMAHEAGRRLARRLNLPFIVDMRDPWSLVPRFVEAVASPVWVRLAQQYEQRAVRQASLVTMNTEAGRDAMRQAYPSESAKFEAIRNGCDEEPMPPSSRDGRFSIRFAGSIYADRDPRPFFRAAEKVISELALRPEQFAIEFIGDVDRFAGVSTVQIASEEGIAAYLTVGGLRSRRDALAFLASATMLLSLPQDSDYSIPAKIYEYLKLDAWMLVLGPTTSATAKLLHGTNADVVDSADVQGIARAIRRRFEEFQSGTLPVAIGQDGRFDRRVQSDRLLELIDRISPAATRRSGPAMRNGSVVEEMDAPPSDMNKQRR